MVQLAIKENILQYHKTLLVWSTLVDKYKANENEDFYDKALIRKNKLELVRKALIEILFESKNGMSLAQLP